MSIESLVTAYGLPALALGAIVEGETVVMIGGAMVHRGLLDYGAAIAAAAAGSFLGDQAWFQIARRYRDRPRIRAMTGTRAFARAREIFERRPGLFVFGFRFIYGMRTVSPLAIGTTDYPALRFMAINALSALVWATLFVTIGFAFGRGLEALFGRLEAAEHLLLALAAAGLFAFGVHRLIRWRGSRG